MCLAAPMQIVELSGNKMTGVCELGGVRRNVDLSLVDNPNIGEYMIVHAGFAIEKLDEAEAAERLKLFSELETSTHPE